MERVKGMPIMVRCTNTINDERWVGSELSAGKTVEMDQYDYEWLLREHPGCVEEIEMTEEDWIQLATERALKCKKAIDEMQRKGVRFESYYTSVIPYGDSLVDGHGYGGGLPDAYNKTKLLEKDVISHQNKIPKFDVVKGMPIRIVITRRIESEKLSDKILEPGTVIDISLFDLEYFNNNFGGYFQEIEMTEEDWIQLATASAKKSQKRISELEQLFGERFESYYTSVIPYGDSLVDGTGYGGGLSDAYNKTKLLQEDIEKFERQCVANLAVNQGGIHR